MECLRAAEVFVLPSYSEGLSRAVLEAMGCGVPVITTHACNLPEVATLECGFRRDPDARVLAGALTDLLRAPHAALHSMGRNGERLVRESVLMDRGRAATGRAVWMGARRRRAAQRTMLERQ